LVVGAYPASGKYDEAGPAPKSMTEASNRSKK